MSWLALLLIGISVTDLVFSVRPSRVVPECVGAAVAVAAALLAGLVEPVDVLALVVIVAAVVGWGQTVTRGFAQDREAIPLVLLGAALGAALLFSPYAGEPAGPLQDWLDATAVPVLAGLDAERALLLLGGGLVQLSTGNVLVRLVLAATHTVNPAKVDRDGLDVPLLKGGRLLGPLERVFIVGLGLAGQLTAASVVIAAKGLLRFPELQSRGEQAQIHQLTEYFLVGSFVSWTLSLGTLVLVS